MTKMVSSPDTACPDRAMFTSESTCDRCGTGESLGKPLFHCNICNEGNHYLCSTCIAHGQHCLDVSHRIFIEASQDATLIDFRFDSIRPRYAHEAEHDQDEYFLIGTEQLLAGKKDIMGKGHSDGDSVVYGYDPIGEDTNEIRLLHVRKADSSFDIVDCELHVVPFESRIEYGVIQGLPRTDPIMDHAILCNGELLPVSAEFYMLLTKVRSLEWQWIWVDDLCNDYSNAYERDRSPTFQSDIFQKASFIFDSPGPIPCQGVHYTSRKRMAEDMLIRAPLLGAMPSQELYLKLDDSKDEIRVLLCIALELPGRAGEPCVVLCKSSLQDKSTIPYHAMSYTWGNLALTDTIWVGEMSNFAFSNGQAKPKPVLFQKFQVSANLKRLLVDFQPRATTITPLWIDALCINQKDKDEVNSQVQQMRKIYQSAIQVMAQLDVAIDPTDPAFQRLELFSHQGADVSLLGSDANLWLPLIPLVRNDYWARVWIQQEISCCNKPALIFCRKHQLSGSALSQFISCMKRAKGGVYDTDLWANLKAECSQSYGIKTINEMKFLWLTQNSTCDPIVTNEDGSQHTNLRNPETPSKSCPGCQAVIAIKRREHAVITSEKLQGKAADNPVSKLRPKERQSSSRPDNPARIIIWTGETPPESCQPLLWLLKESRRLKCSDPKDKVYGLLGLVKDLTVDDLKVDYGQTVQNVYISAAKALVQKFGTLTWLCQAILQENHNEHNSPSWVPDWSSNDYVSDMTDFAPRPSVSASGSLPPRAHFSVDNLTLKVVGFQIDEVLRICPSFFTKCSRPVGLPGARERWVHSHCDGIVIDVLLKIARWMSTTCSALLENDRDPSVGTVWSEDFREWLSHLSSHNLNDLTKTQIAMLARTLVADYSFQTVEQKLDAFNLEIQHIDQSHQKDRPCPECTHLRSTTYAENPLRFQYGILARLRRLFITAKANMGLAQPTGREGDQVWIVFGCAIPLLLRPSKLGFQVVGDAYLDGFMSGSAVKGVEESVSVGDVYGNYIIREINLI